MYFPPPCVSVQINILLIQYGPLLSSVRKFKYSSLRACWLGQIIIMLFLSCCLNQFYCPDSLPLKTISSCILMYSYRSFIYSFRSLNLSRGILWAPESCSIFHSALYSQICMCIALTVYIKHIKAVWQHINNSVLSLGAIHL